jgi:hypothetical protein
MGLEGFSNNASGGMSPGDHLYAKTFNKLATSADKAQVGPSDGVIFTSNNGGVGMYIPQQTFEQQNLLQQFQIVVEPYEVAGQEVGLSIIRVVKGEVVWTPKLPQDLIVPTNSCTSQTTIENWYALPTFPIIDDENSTFIGDGGIRVPNIEGINVGIYVFKPTMLPVDVDPIIVAVPETGYSITCPVQFPGTPPVEEAVWEVVKIGSAKYEVPEGSEEDTPPQWIITQKFIGSMTLPGGGSSIQSPQSNLPAQLVKGDQSGAMPSPFQCQIVSVNGERYLQIAKGTIAYSASNMPFIQYGAFTHTKQAYATKVQICPEGMRTYGDIYPYWPFDDPPYSVTHWMEDGGGYKLSDTSNPIAIYAFKWDVDKDTLPFQGNPSVDTGLPTIAIFPDSNSGDIAKVVKDCGPSIYQNTLNVQKMEGYEEEQLQLDWGHCHTTYLNPRKFGYNYKLIAAITPNTNVFEAFVTIDRPAVPLVQNMVQNIIFVGEASGGAVTISLGGLPSTIPFPVTNFYDLFNPVYSDELTLINCLHSIPPIVIPGVENPISLVGNVQVNKASESSYYVTFVNQLQGINLPLLQVNVSGVTKYQNKFDIVQYHTGMLDLTTPMQFGMTQLMNKEGLKETDDPYYKNKDATPAWKDIVNREDVVNCKNFSGDVTTDGMFGMSQFSNINPEYGIANGCTDEGECSPFKVRRNGVVGEEVVYEICPGTVNNIVPQNIYDTFILVDGDSVWLRCDTRSSDNEYPYQIMVESGTTMPSDTDDFGYVKVAKLVNGKIEQYITGSLWTDRIKLGTLTATYYYARI